MLGYILDVRKVFGYCEYTNVDSLDIAPFPRRSVDEFMLENHDSAYIYLYAYIRLMANIGHGIKQ